MQKRFRALGAVCALALTLGGCGPAGEPAVPASAPVPQTKGDSVVYGVDDRMDVYAHPDATLRARAQQATVALMDAATLDTTDPNNVAIISSTLEESYGLCPTERFLKDPTAALCSGTLIDDDLVLTAGHCVLRAPDPNDPFTPVCADARFVFKYYRTSSSARETVTTEDIFSCKSIVAQKDPYRDGGTLDYAIIRLDRPATPRFTPAPVRPGSSAMAVGDKVAVIGSGSGVPFKIDAGGTVKDARAGTLDYFVATTDTFGGNSGSGVYELGGYAVAGLLVNGQEDYVPSNPDDLNSCWVVNVCPEAGCDTGSGPDAEGITYVRPAIDALCQATTSARLCPAPPPPPPPVTPGTYTFSASNTASATMNTVNTKLTLAAGQRVTVGTCGLTDASFTGDTYLRVAGPTGVEVAANDDSCGGRGSKLAFTAAVAGDHEIRAGCYGAGSCSGTVAWADSGGTPTSGSLDFSASNTHSAQQNTVNQALTLTGGQTLTVGTCGVAGASATGDTYLRLFNPSGTQVALNDDGCGGSSSKITYTVPTGTGGTYQVRAGCYGTKSCGGTLAWTIQ